jgi:hypothetical protein
MLIWQYLVQHGLGLNKITYEPVLFGIKTRMLCWALCGTLSPIASICREEVLSYLGLSVMEYLLPMASLFHSSKP